MLEVVHAGQLQRVYFRVPEECIVIMHDEDFKKGVEEEMNLVPRDNPREKTIAFLKHCRELCFLIDHRSRMIERLRRAVGPPHPHTPPLSESFL